MGIRRISDSGAFRAALINDVQKIQTQIINYLKRLGELCLIECRTNKTYQDQTGNLTASMGYVIVANGHVIVEGGFNAQFGGEVGRSFAQSKASLHSSGYVLVVVAGMDYAFSVESKGYNVLSSAELLAERELPKMIAQMKRNISKMK